MFTEAALASLSPTPDLHREKKSAPHRRRAPSRGPAPVPPTHHRLHIPRHLQTATTAASTLGASPTPSSPHLSSAPLFRKSPIPWRTALRVTLPLFVLIATGLLLPFILGPDPKTTPRSLTRTPAAQGGPGSGGSGGAVRIAVIAPFDSPSTLGPTWGEVLEHIGARMTWTEPGVQLRAVDVASLAAGDNVFEGDDIVLAMGVNEAGSAAAVAQAVGDISTFVSLGGTPDLRSLARLAGASVPPKAGDGGGGPLEALWEALSASARLEKQRAQVVATVEEMYDRRTSDDLLFSLLVLVNEVVRPVAAVSNSTKRADAGLDAVTCMVSNCGKEMFNCFAKDATCRAALDCMNGCSFNDQVCSYRCIASYESPALEKFSLCIIQKHNCLGLSAEIPEGPNPEPMTTFRGQPLTHEVSDGLFVGWLDGAQAAIDRTSMQLEPHSWRIFAGKNPAFDFFPCQFQLFYPGRAKNSMWYQPVFKVITIDGRSVWRQRLYRVRKDATPGRFTLSVLDNGVTSLEKWSILDCDDALEWCIFYYRGAAAAAGMSYTGAVLGSRTGDWPTDPQALRRIEGVLDGAGIKMWELSTVNNDDCVGAPLGRIGPQ